jgi:hypothetical protein
MITTLCAKHSKFQRLQLPNLCASAVAIVGHQEKSLLLYVQAVILPTGTYQETMGTVRQNPIQQSHRRCAMAKTIQKPKSWPVNPYINPKPETMKIFLAKTLVPIMAVIIEERDQQVLIALGKKSFRYPRVPFDPFFYTIMKRDRQIKKWIYGG